MVYIETVIVCQNCDYQKELYNLQCLEIEDILIDFNYDCCKCGLKCCDNCSLRDIENNVYCEKCYWKYVQDGLRNIKND